MDDVWGSSRGLPERDAPACSGPGGALPSIGCAAAPAIARVRLRRPLALRSPAARWPAYADTPAPRALRGPRGPCPPRRCAAVRHTAHVGSAAARPAGRGAPPACREKARGEAHACRPSPRRLRAASTRRRGRRRPRPRSPGRPSRPRHSPPAARPHGPRRCRPRPRRGRAARYVPRPPHAARPRGRG